MPTAEAEILYPKAMAIIEDLRQLEEEIFASRTTVAGELIIGASTIPGTYILPQIAASFKEEYPGISFEIRINDTENTAEAVASSKLLLGVVGAKIPGLKLNYLPLCDDELILIAAKNSDIPDKLDLKKLCQLPFIVRERGSGTRKSIENFLTEQKSSLSQFNICATLGSSAAVKEAVKANLGVSIVSRHAIADEIASDRIKEVQIDGLPSTRHFYVITSPRRSLPNHYSVFLEKLKQMS